MPHAQRTIVIARPPAEVYAFFADAENDPQWRSAVKSIKREGPLAVGARYTQRVAGPGGRAGTRWNANTRSGSVCAATWVSRRNSDSV